MRPFALAVSALYILSNCLNYIDEFVDHNRIPDWMITSINWSYIVFPNNITLLSIRYGIIAHIISSIIVLIFVLLIMRFGDSWKRVFYGISALLILTLFSSFLVGSIIFG